MLSKPWPSAPSVSWSPPNLSPWPSCCLASPFGGDQEADGADGHVFESINFLGDFHSTDLGGKCGAGTADYNDGGDERAEFARHGDGNGGGDIADGAKAAELIGSLQSED